MQNSHTKSNSYIVIIITGIWLLFSSIWILQANNESKIYEALYTQNIPATTRRWQKATNIQNIHEAYLATKNQEYEKALSYISGTDSEAYYNRGTLQTLLAYQNATQNTVSWMQTAQTYITQAQNNFALAKQLWVSSEMKNAITTNQKTLETLSPVIDIKTCYTIGQTIVDEISNIHQQTKDIDKLLEEERSQIQQASTRIGSDCSQKFITIINNDQQNITQFNQILDTNKKTYISDLSDKINEPILCIQTPYDNILPTIDQGKNTIKNYSAFHENIINTIQNKDSKRVKELCEQTKNDAQINQTLDNTIQKLLASLQENTMQQKIKKHSPEVEYNNFFGEDEQKALQQIQQTNQSRIETILQIRSKGNYTPQKYIDDMFNQFYGNSWDFIDLHK